LAAIEPIERSYGTVWRVKWREGGRHGQPQTVSCHGEIQAKKLKELMDEAGNHMPAAKILDAYGLLWVLGEQQAEEQPPAVKTISVSDLCWRYLDALAKSPRPPSDRTLKDYCQYVRHHVDTHWFGKLSADDADQEQARDWQAEIAAKPGFSARSANKVRTGVVAPAFRWARIR
jgi:hypothetical protein